LDAVLAVDVDEALAVLVAELHVPYVDLQPVPQYSLVAPQYPRLEQQFPNIEFKQVSPLMSPHLPCVETVKVDALGAVSAAETAVVKKRMCERCMI
jgi:hypothetical protein